MSMETPALERLKEARGRARTAMSDAVVCFDPAHGGHLTARSYLILSGIKPPVADQFMGLIAIAYDHEMASDWTAAYMPIAVKKAPPPKVSLERVKQLASTLWAILAAYGAIALIEEIVRGAP